MKNYFKILLITLAIQVVGVAIYAWIINYGKGIEILEDLGLRILVGSVIAPILVDII